MTGRGGRFAALIVAASLLFSGAVAPAWAEEPEPAPTVEPTVEPTPEPTEEPAPEPDPAVEPTEAPAPTEEPSPEPPTAEGETVVYTGTITRLADGDESTLALLRTAQGYLAVDTAGWPASTFATTVAVTLAVPSGVTLTGNADADFTALSNAAASTALTIVGVGAARSLARETASFVNQTPNTAATHRIYAVLVSPDGANTSAGLRPSADEFADTVEQVDDYWMEQSGGTIGFELVGTVPWYSSSYTCWNDTGSFAMWNQAAAKAKSQLGYASGKNNHLVLVFPSNTSCGGAIGLGTIGWSVNEGGLAWVIGDGSGNGTANPSQIGKREVQTLAHELGHNMTLGHANWLKCGVAAPTVPADLTTSNLAAASCDMNDYGDVFDVMGFGISGKTGGALSSTHAIRAGIWPSSAWATHPQNGGNFLEYELNDVALNSGLRAVVVQDTDGVNYFVEYRGFQDEDLQYSGYGCDNQACVPSAAGVRILRLEQGPYFNGFPYGWLGIFGDNSVVIGREESGVKKVNYVTGETWRSKPANPSAGLTVHVVSIGANKATVRVTKPINNSDVPGIG